MDLVQFYFFNLSDQMLFVRSDAESAGWQVDEMTIHCVFPYDPDKILVRGMRIGFKDADGVFQPFEIRNVRFLEPDHYQEITGEHIVISELTDVHTSEVELDNVSASSALSSCLAFQPSGMTGAARWVIGNDTSSGTSSGDIGMGSVFQNIRNVETNWNVYITPRVTFNSSGITGRYLDISPAQGVWHGVRLSVDKNMDEVGVTIDDTEVKTALYGYGGTKYTETANHLDKTGEKINLVGYNWTNPPAGCSKPTNAAYVLDTNANALYSRNGQPRFGFYQNADIDDQATLAQKTWEALQTVNKPQVTVDCMVRDLYRMGYKDEPIRLHDKVIVELRPINDVLTLDIIKLSVDLLDPTATRPTIGAYIPNIVYIQRETARSATGGASGRISGKSGGETANEAQWSEFIAEYKVNNTLFSYHAEQIDHDMNVLRAAGLDITAEGVLIYATDNVNMIGSRLDALSDRITLEVTARTDADTALSGRIDVEAGRITQIVTNVGADGTVTAASICLAIRGSNDSAAYITANKIYLNSQNTYLSTALANTLNCQTLSAVVVATNSLSTNSITLSGVNHTVSWQSKKVCTGVGSSLGTGYYALTDTSLSGIVDYNYGNPITGLSYSYIYYLGYTV